MDNQTILALVAILIIIVVYVLLADNRPLAEKFNEKLRAASAAIVF